MNSHAGKDGESFKQIHSIASAEHSDGMWTKNAKYIHPDFHTQRAPLLHIHDTNAITDDSLMKGNSKRDQDQTITGSIEKSIEGGFGEAVFK